MQQLLSSFHDSDTMFKEDYVKGILKKAKDRERYLRVRSKYAVVRTEKEKKELLRMIKSRVWMRFLSKVGKFLKFVFSVLAGIAALIGFLALVGVPGPIALCVGFIVGIISPMILIVLRDVYNDSKREVERENRELMYTLGKSE